MERSLCLLGSAEYEVPDIKINGGCEKSYEHHGETFQHEVAESNIVPFFCCKSGDDDVRGSANDGAVAAVARADRKRPPHIVRVGQT